MKKLRIVYDRSKCIAAGTCEAEAPEYFQVVDGKAVLANGQKQKGELFVLDVMPQSEEEFERIVVAGRSCPVNAIGVVDLDTQEQLVTTELSAADHVKQVAATYNEDKEWQMDPKGYFLIRIDTEKKVIEAGHCGARNVVDTVITGTNATEMFNTIVREGLVSSLQHAAYLGKELYKAKLCLENGTKYVQDDTLFNEKYD